MPPESTGHVIDGDLWDSYYPAGRDKGAPSGAQNKRDNDSIRDNARLSLRPEPKVIHSSAPAPDDATSTAKMLAPQRFSAGMRRLFRPSEKVATRPADRVTTSTQNLLLLFGIRCSIRRNASAPSMPQRRAHQFACHRKRPKNGGRGWHRYHRRFATSFICNETAVASQMISRSQSSIHSAVTANCACPTLWVAPCASLHQQLLVGIQCPP